MSAHPPLPDPRWNRALAHAARREVLQEELLLRQLLHDQPDHLAARLRVAHILVDREEYQQALQWVDTPEGGDIQDADLLLLRGQLQGQLGLELRSLQTFEALVKQQPHQELGWLFLGEVLARSGQTLKALQARFRALRLAQSKGLWLGPESTEPALVDLVTQVISEFRTQRRDWLFAILHDQVQNHFCFESRPMGGGSNPRSHQQRGG